MRRIVYYLHTKYLFARTFHSAVNSRLPRRVKSRTTVGKVVRNNLCTLQIFQFLLSEIGQIGVASEKISRSSAAHFRKYSGLKFTGNFPKHADCVNTYTLECQQYRFSKAGIYTHTDDHHTNAIHTELVMATSRRWLSVLPSADGNTADNQGIICSLCLAPHTQMSTPLSWKNIALTRLHLTHESHVCRLCRDEAG